MNYILQSAPSGKAAGQFFTPDHVAKSLVNWVVLKEADVLLDPSCGDGAILTHHSNTRGIERDPYLAWSARQRNPTARIDSADFFEWAAETSERFDCAAGNPPFVRFQNFEGISKSAAMSLCARNGVALSGLSSAWAAFLIATASLLRPAGRMAFVVPAEIGHAPYAVPLIEFLLNNFSTVHIVAIREKIFPRLSEDCWLLYCEEYGGKSTHVKFSRLETFRPTCVPPVGAVSVPWLEAVTLWNGRLRPYLLDTPARNAYLNATQEPDSIRLGDFAKVGIGYITGDNDFFHLSASQARLWNIPTELLVPSVRRGKSLDGDIVDQDMIKRWEQADEPCYLLSLSTNAAPPAAVARYLATERGVEASRRYKCRIRRPWYVVPRVIRPDYFLQYMSGKEVKLARNDASAACTNSLHAVQITDRSRANCALPHWGSKLTKLSCELEGHPLGGGMLKMEPREAARLLFQSNPSENKYVAEALNVMRNWRHISIAS